MDKSLYIAMTGASATLRGQSTVAHNLANADTTGFQAALGGTVAVPVEGPGLASRVATVQRNLGVSDAPGARTVKVSVRPECFTGAIEQVEWPQRKRYDEFDFGYVLTVHKAQGSQWDDVVLFDESFAFPDSRDRWLYTGVTRAAKRLTVVIS